MQYRQFHAAMCEKQLKKNTKFKNCEKLSDVSRQSPLGLGSCNTTELAGGTVIVQLYLSFSSCWFNFCTSLVFFAHYPVSLSLFVCLCGHGHPSYLPMFTPVFTRSFRHLCDTCAIWPKSGILVQSSC